MSDFFGLGGVAQAVGSVASASIQAGAISDAAKKAQESADKAQNLLQGRYDTTRGDLLPYNQTGQAASGQLQSNLPSYGTPDRTYTDQANFFVGGQQAFANKAAGQFDTATGLSSDLARFGSGAGGQAALENTPGYQFTRQQGLHALQNGMAAKGLGVSGAALKGAAAYATGLADQTYQTQYANAQQRYANALTNAKASQGIADNYGALATNSLGVNTGVQGNLTNAYNRLLGTSSLGENAASQTGTAGATLGNAAAGAQMAGGAAGAAGSIQTGNAIAGGINGLANAYSQNQAQKAYGQQQQGTLSTYNNSNTGQSYQSSSNPDENF